MVFSARAAAFAATRDGDARVGDTREGDAREGDARLGDTRPGEARLGDADREADGDAIFFAAAAALAEARVVDGRADEAGEAVAGEAAVGAAGAAAGVPPAWTALAAAGKAEADIVAGDGAGAATALDEDALVPLLLPEFETIPVRVFSSNVRISGARAVDFSDGASFARSASPGMQPLRSFTPASTLATVSSHEITSIASAWRNWRHRTVRGQPK